MARVKGGFVVRRRHKKVLKLARGYFGSKHRIFKTANEQVMKSLVYAYRDRRNTKRNFRRLWIVRINLYDTYERFVLQQTDPRIETCWSRHEPQNVG